MNLQFYKTPSGSYATSHLHLHDLANAKMIKCEIINQRHGLHWTVSTIRYTTHHGIVLAECEKDSTLGYCSQAYGVKIPVSDLKCPKKSAIEFEIYEREIKMLRNKVIRKIAFKERGRDAFN